MAAPVNSVGKPSVERPPFNSTSFQKKTRSKLISIPGTRPSVQNGQLLVSTGVTSLDYLLGQSAIEMLAIKASSHSQCVAGFHVPNPSYQCAKGNAVILRKDCGICHCQVKTNMPYV